MVAHKFESQKMLVNGLVLGLTTDLKPPGKFNFLQNVRTLIEGVIQSRPEVDSFLTLNPPAVGVPHTIKTIINKVTGGINRIVGTGDTVYTGNGNPLNSKTFGFSSDPLSIVDFRPEESIEAYAYITDKQKSCKISVSDILSDIGINAPTKALVFSLLKPNRKIIDNITAGDVGDWNHLTGSAGVPIVENRINQLITAILYDSITPSFASIVPNIFPPTLQTGCIVTLNGVEDVFVEEIISASLLAGTSVISNISYDTGPNGLCTIVLSTSDISLRRNSILLLNGAEYIKVIEVTRDINNIPSIRASTVGVFAIGNTVVGAASFRAYVANAYVPGNTIFAEGLTTAVGAAGISAITKAIDVDLTNANGKLLKSLDFLHCSLKISDPTILTEIQLQFDCDSVVPFNNYFYYPISPNFFTSSAAQATSTLSTIQQTIQREELISKLQQLSDQYTDQTGYRRYDLGLDPIDYSQPSPVGQTALGSNQWIEFFIKLEDLKRVGTDSTRTKKDIKGIRLSINSTAAIAVGLDSIWVGGGSDLESSRGDKSLIPYNYIWRVRDPRNGTISNWSPPLREGISVSRIAISLAPLGANADFPANYVIDIARFGGTSNDYRIIGTIKNDGSIFQDTVSDLTADANKPAGRRLSGDQIGDEEVFDFYKPFTYFDTPKLGT